MWQVYADEIGLPAGPSAGSESELGQATRAPQGRPSARMLAHTVVGITAVAVGVVTLVGGIALWRGSRPSTVELAPAADVGKIAPALVTAEMQSLETNRENDHMPAWITFDFDSQEINDDSKVSLQQIVIAMNSHPGWRVALEGHTDARGPADHNRSLSERRAEAVKAYLEAAGIAPERLSAVGFGALRPAAPNNARGNLLNRRVEIRRR